MSCRITVRTSGEMRQWDVEEWTALVVLASLSAAPRSWEELFSAVRRYQPDHQLPETAREVSGREQAVDPGMWCLIDLDGKSVVAGGGFELPDKRAGYEPSEGEVHEGFPLIWMDTPADWLFRTASDGWQDEVACRADGNAKSRVVDARVILYGQPLFEFLADELLAHVGDCHGADKDRQWTLTREIHARWLMTPRDDLLGRTPRQVLLADRQRITMDLEHRALQWSRQGHAPPALSSDSDAYRYGGFGTIEIITYFDLVRSLLDKGWRIVRKPSRTKASLASALAAHAERWVQKPYEGDGPSVAHLVESERRRVPITSDGAAFDCDCPICRAAADGMFGAGPAFLWFDGHHLELEDMFAFSMEERYEDWKQCHPDEDQLEFESSAGKSRDSLDKQTATAEPALPDGRQRLAEADESDSQHEFPAHNSVWKSSYVDWSEVAQSDTPPHQSLFALSFPLAELITDLKCRAGGTDFVRPLNEAYDALRRSTDAIASKSTARHFSEVLERACESFPELTPKCADLQSHVDEVVRRL